MRITIVSLVATILALAIGIIAGRQVEGLQNKAAALPLQRPVMPEPTPPAQQKVVDDFNDPNNQVEPVTPKSTTADLTPVDPVRKAAANSAGMYQTVSKWAYTAAWIIPALGAIALYRKLKRAVVRRMEELRHETECGEPNELQPEAGERDGLPDGQGDAGSAPESPPA
jgi:hypothetical protein